jgi:hypothetical protein
MDVAFLEKEVAKVLDNRIGEILPFVSEVGKIIESRIAEIAPFFSVVKPDALELADLKEKYKLDDDKKFNVFKNISNNIKINEDFYSKTLKKILDPKTVEIGNIAYLNLFVDTLKNINKNITKHIFSDNVEVISGQGSSFIDILISDEKHCIIIENKICDATDQPNQLARYYETMVNKGKTVDAIVYIPFNQNKRPNLDSYEDQYKQYKDQIKNVLVHLPAVYKDSNNENDLAKGFLDKCVKLADNFNDKTAHVYIEQFSKLIKAKGGLEIMGNETEKRIIRKLLDSYESRSTANEIAAVWEEDKKNELFGQLLREELIEKYGLININEDIIGRKIKNDIYVALWPEPPEIGFFCTSGKKAFKDVKDVLKDVINDEEFTKHLSSEYDNDNDGWIVKAFEIETFKGSFDEIVSFFGETVKNLEEKSKAVLL